MAVYTEVSDDQLDAVLADYDIVESMAFKGIAEGVENEAQQGFLTREGCDEMQGYLHGRPMPFDEYERRFLND